MKKTILPPLETHGKMETKEPTMLEQVWGQNDMARYGTLDEQSYTSQVKEMGRTDLEAHARRLGVVVLQSSARLQEKLISEFKRYKITLHKPASIRRPIKIDAASLKVLAEGR